MQPIYYIKKDKCFYFSQKNGHSYITAESPDILCLQETKCEKNKIPRDVEIEGYHRYWLSGDKEGYSGTGLYSKVKPIEVKYGLGNCILITLVITCESNICLIYVEYVTVT